MLASGCQPLAVWQEPDSPFSYLVPLNFLSLFRAGRTSTCIGSAALVSRYGDFYGHQRPDEPEHEVPLSYRLRPRSQSAQRWVSSVVQHRRPLRTDSHLSPYAARFPTRYSPYSANSGRLSTVRDKAPQKRLQYARRTNIWAFPYCLASSSFRPTSDNLAPAHLLSPCPNDPNPVCFPAKLDTGANVSIMCASLVQEVQVISRRAAAADSHITGLGGNQIAVLEIVTVRFRTRNNEQVWYQEEFCVVRNEDLGSRHLAFLSVGFILRHGFLVRGDALTEIVMAENDQN